MEYSDCLNSCMTCDYTGYEWAKDKVSNECVCPQCQSEDYYIIEE